MAITLEEFVNRIGFDFDDRGLRDASRSLDDFGKRVQQVGTKLTTRLTLPIVGFGVLSVAAFNKQAQAIAQVEAGIESTGMAAGFTSKELQKMATDLQRNTLFGDERILSDLTANLLTFTNITGERFAQTQKAALNLAARVGQDLTSSAIQLGKALNDPIANLGALSRTGIQFSDEQTDLIKNLAQTNRLAEAQTIILEELEKQYGGSAEAAADVGAGPFFQFLNTLGDLTEAIGKIIFETAKLGDFFVGLSKRVEALTRIIAGLNDFQKILLVGIPAILAAVGPLLIAVGTLTRLLSFLNLALVPIYVKILLITAAVVAAFIILEDLFSFLVGKDSVIGTLFTFAGELIQFIIQKTFDLFAKITNGVASWVTGIIDTVKSAFIGMFDFLIGKADQLLSKIPFIGDKIKDLNNGDALTVNTNTEGMRRFFDGSDTAIASSGTGAAVGAVNRSSSVNVNSRISLSVPEGTPEEQRRALQSTAEQAASTAFADAINAALTNNPAVE